MNKVITLNEIEPQPLSFRAAAGLAFTLNVSVALQSGTMLDLGFAAPVVLQLAPRSGGATLTYTGVADVVGIGIVTFTLPADVLTDPNGYRLRLLAKIEGLTTLLAHGVGMMIPGTESSAGAGEGIPSRTPSKGVFNLNITRNDTNTWQFTLWGDTAKTIPADLTGAIVTAQIRAAIGGTILTSMPCEIKDAVNGVVWMTLSGTSTGALPATSYWDMQISYPDGDLKTPVSGRVILSEDVTRP